LGLCCPLEINERRDDYFNFRVSRKRIREITWAPVVLMPSLLLHGGSRRAQQQRIHGTSLRFHNLDFSTGNPASSQANSPPWST
jgi:hypothetical protein